MHPACGADCAQEKPLDTGWVETIMGHLFLKMHSSLLSYSGKLLLGEN